jgi:hypothetical protein
VRNTDDEPRALRDTVLESVEEACRDWATPRAATHRGIPTAFRLRCSMESRRRPRAADSRLPPELQAFWARVRSARLFEDVDYGQWGLVFLSPADAERETKTFQASRRRDSRDGDLVVGRFLGDQDLMIVRSDPAARDFGQILIALPLDKRSDWYTPARSLGAFLRAFFQAEGAKFWEDTDAVH